MLILVIRTDKPEAELGLYDDNSQLAYKTWHAHRELSTTILSNISEMLRANSKTLTHLQGIVVYRGPGSFTGLRIGVTVANTLAASAGAAIVGSQSEEWVRGGIQALLNGKNDTLVVPDYGSEAHITQPKK